MTTSVCIDFFHPPELQFEHPNNLESSFTVVSISRMDPDRQQQTLCVDDNVALAAFYSLTAIDAAVSTENIFSGVDRMPAHSISTVSISSAIRHSRRKAVVKVYVSLI